MQFWQADIETLAPQELAALQLEKLRNSIEQAGRSQFYGRRFASLGLSANSLRSLDDLRRFPFTCKDELRQEYPWGLLSVAQDQVIRMHCTSGTTGNPVAVLHSRRDLHNWANLVARSLFAAGTRPGEVFQNSSGYGLFTGGLGFQNGAELLGCLSIPAGSGNSLRQIKLMRDFGTTCLHAVPSYLGRLHSVFIENGLQPAKDTRLKRLFIGAEPHSEETRQRIQKLYGCKAYNSFGMTEMNGPGVAFECECQNGMHLWEDAYIMEIIDPETLQALPEGELGELVLTTLDREAMPIIRYRTRDLTRIISEKCPCGRSSRRIDRITGRSDDMFIIKGCNVFPIQIERILMRINEIGSDYLITLDSNEEGDFMLVQAELKHESFSDQFPKLELLRKRIAAAMRDEVQVTPKVQLVNPGTLPKNEGKAVRVKDLRKN
ncbi:MAG: phenylacetate--CoA ligase [Lentisphaeria bacterium]|nr:phenylacetate--CoA ligase [Lentisphaeria bacterium]